MAKASRDRSQVSNGGNHSELYSRLVEMLGSPISTTLYVARWHVADDLDVVSSSRGDCTLWITWSHMEAPPPIGELVRVGVGINSNVAHKTVPTLRRGALALRITTSAEDEVRDVLRYLARRGNLPQ